MQLFSNITDLLIGLLEKDDKDWWVEITTVKPSCTYYFGEFKKLTEAKTACPGYIEDLENEGAEGIKVTIKRCQPKVLTICDEEEI